MKRLKQSGLGLLLVVMIGGLTPTPTHAAPMREFIMSCTYGVLAGTLVGTASLAFTDQPGDNLNHVARGASIGLYAGILLGLYVVYVVPSQIEQQEQEELLNQPGYPYPPEEGHLKKEYRPKLQVYPLISERRGGLEGAAARLEVFSF